MTWNPEGPELTCSFCGNGSPHKLIAGPRIFICDECVARSLEIAEAGDCFVQQPTAGSTQIPSSHSFLARLFPARERIVRTQPICEFCGKTSSDLVQPPSVLGTHALICGECRQLCHQIIWEQLEHS